MTRGHLRELTQGLNDAIADERVEIKTVGLVHANGKKLNSSLRNLFDHMISENQMALEYVDNLFTLDDNEFSGLHYLDYSYGPHLVPFMPDGLEHPKSLELLCRYSLITNRLRYCGPKDAYKDFLLLLEGKKYDEEKVKKHFKRYEGLYVYLDYIAEKHNKKPFDYDIVEAYWTGNELLDKFNDEDLKKIIRNLTKRGLPEKHADSLISKLPKGMNPSHSFNVLFIGVGMTTGSVPTNIITMNKCILSIGKVLKILKDQLMVAVLPLIMKDELLEFGDQKIVNVEYNPKFFKEIKVGDKIAIHWDYACKILTKNEEENLKKYTQKNIDALNQALFFSSAPKIV